MKTAMTPEQVASLLNGREIGDEITSAEAKEAAADGLVIVYGASDDLCELQGAISDEVGCNDGGDILFTRTGKVFQPPDRDELEVLEKFGVADLVGKDVVKFEALWCAEKGGPSWTYNVPFPHAQFAIMEDGECYCRGFVFRLADAFAKNAGIGGK